MITQDQVRAILHHNPMRLRTLVDELGGSVEQVSRVTKSLRSSGELSIDGEGVFYLVENKVNGEEKEIAMEEKKPSAQACLPRLPACRPPVGRTGQTWPADRRRQEDLQESIRCALKESEYRLSPKHLAEKIFGNDKKSTKNRIQKELEAMITRSEVERDNKWYCWIKGEEKPAEATQWLNKCREDKRKKMAEQKKTRGDPLAAIDRLAQRIQPRPVGNIELKCQVLRKLAPLLDKEVGDLLEEIAEDLRL